MAFICFHHDQSFKRNPVVDCCAICVLKCLLPLHSLLHHCSFSCIESLWAATYVSWMSLECHPEPSVIEGNFVSHVFKYSKIKPHLHIFLVTFLLCFLSPCPSPPPASPPSVLPHSTLPIYPPFPSPPSPHQP